MVNRPRRRTRTIATADPTEEELKAFLDQVRRILADPEEDWYPANTFKLEGEFELLQLFSGEDRTRALLDAATEVGPADYESPEAPGTADEPVCRGARMIPFRWASKRFGCDMFVKFAIHRGYLYAFSLHVPDYPKKKQRRSS